MKKIIKLSSILFREPEDVDYPFTPVLLSYKFALKKGELCTDSPKDKSGSDDPKFFKPNELSETLEADPSYDVYQLGKLFYLMMNIQIVEARGYNPEIINSREVLAETENCDQLDFDDYYYDHFRDLVSKMINTDPGQRPSIEEVKAELIQIRDDVDDYISTERAKYEDNISRAVKALEQEPENSELEREKEQNEEELADFPITQSMYVEMLKDYVDTLYESNASITESFNKMYATELAAIEEKKKMLNNGSLEEIERRILV